MPDGDVPYQRQLRIAVREGLERRLGGRWGGFTLVGPLLIGGFVGLWLAGNDKVSAAGVSLALVAGLLGVGLWMLLVVVVSMVNAPVQVHRKITGDRDRIRSERDVAVEALAAAEDELRALERTGQTAPQVAINAGMYVEVKPAPGATVTVNLPGEPPVSVTAMASLVGADSDAVLLPRGTFLERFTADAVLASEAADAVVTRAPNSAEAADPSNYFAKLTLDHPTLLADLDFEHGQATFRPFIELRNHLPERLDFQMVAFTARVGGFTITNDHRLGIVNPASTAGFDTEVIELPIWAGFKIIVAMDYDIVYGPSVGDRYLIRERRRGVTFGGLITAEGQLVLDQNYHASAPPLTEIIDGGQLKPAVHDEG